MIVFSNCFIQSLHIHKLVRKKTDKYTHYKVSRVLRVKNDVCQNLKQEIRSYKQQLLPMQSCLTSVLHSRTGTGGVRMEQFVLPF